MGDVYQTQWMQRLPWCMLGYRIRYQPALDASAAQMVLNMSPRLPGQLLGHPGPPLSNSQVKALLDQLYRLADRQPVPTSGKRSFLDINDKTKDVTHVYVKVDGPESLCPKFEGPYKVVNRPSRSQVEVQIGVYRDGEPRTLTYHWTSCKPAHMREGATEGCRPMLGRRPKAVSGPDSTVDQVNKLRGSPVTVHAGSPPILTSQDPPNSNEQISPVVSNRPVRSTRNSNPNYVDSLSFYSQMQGGTW